MNSVSACSGVKGAPPAALLLLLLPPSCCLSVVDVSASAAAMGRVTPETDSRQPPPPQHDRQTDRARRLGSVVASPFNQRAFGGGLGVAAAVVVGHHAVALELHALVHRPVPRRLRGQRREGRRRLHSFAACRPATAAAPHATGQASTRATRAARGPAWGVGGCCVVVPSTCRPMSASFLTRSKAGSL